MIGSKSKFLYLPVLVLVFALQRTLTPTIMWRQLVAATSWRPFWHTNTCLAANCVSPLASCAGRFADTGAELASVSRSGGAGATAAAAWLALALCHSGGGSSAI